MKNITISMDEDLARATRIEAAKAGKSVSKFVAQLLRDRIENGRDRRSERVEVLQKFLSGPDLDLMDGTGRPLREQIYEQGVSGYQRAGVQPRSANPRKAG
ncbi:MAG TPA: hypothetical protein VHG92_02065 [Afifellaceae bacterium]|nr:hypothetical protein [Afifellaceae bacterium]